MDSTITPTYPAGGAYDSRPQSPTVSVGEWLITYLIMCIPLVGVIMLFVWAFSSSTAPSKANWAKAALLVTVIFMVLGFFFAGTLIALLSTMSAGHRVY
jgi:Na+/phosphate symporter